MSHIPPSIRMPASAANEDDIASMAKAAWHKRGWLCICVDEVVDPFIRQILVNTATERYGKRQASCG